VPTREWQDSLSARLASAGAQASAYGCIVEQVNTTTQAKKSDVLREGSAGNNEGSSQPDWKGVYTLEKAEGKVVPSHRFDRIAEFRQTSMRVQQRLWKVWVSLLLTRIER
jgi:hypothetical protein